MSRLTKGEASADAAISAVDALASGADTDTLVGGAADASVNVDQASADAATANTPIADVDDVDDAVIEPAEPPVAAVLLAPFEGIPRGLVVVGSLARVEPLVRAETARLATEQDLAIAGRNVRAI